MPPILDENCSNLDFVMKVFGFFFLFGDMNPMFLGSPVLFNITHSSPELRPGGV